MTAAHPNHHRAVASAIFLAGLLAAASLVTRGASSTGSLWLDEIWSLKLAASVASPLEIVTRIKHDNNHFLNSLFLYVAGPQRAWFVYRLPSIVAGVLAVLVAGHIGGRRGTVERLTAMTLFAGSYLLTHYSAEARGYSTAVLFALCGFACLTRMFASGGWKWAVFLALCSCFSILSHPTSFYAYIAAVVYCLSSVLSRWIERRREDARMRTAADPAPSVNDTGRRSRRQNGEPPEHSSPARLLSIAFLGLGPPFALSLALYFFNLRDAELGGGPEYVLVRVLTETGSLAMGGPLGGPLAVVCSLVFAAGVVGGLLRVWRENPTEAGYFAIATLLPLLHAVLASPPFLFPRYFLTAAAFGLLLWSFALGSVLRAGRWGQMAFAPVLLAYLVGNSLHVAELIHLGRGQYLQALQLMASRDPSDVIVISSDHNHGNRILIDFYQQYLDPPRHVVYQDAGRWAGKPPGWLIIHRYRTWHDPPVPPTYDAEGAHFVLVQVFQCAKLSGWKWLCYRRELEGERRAESGAQRARHVINPLVASR